MRFAGRVAVTVAILEMPGSGFGHDVTVTKRMCAVAATDTAAADSNGAAALFSGTGFPVAFVCGDG